MFGHKQIAMSVPFIQALGPLVVEKAKLPATADSDCDSEDAAKTTSASASSIDENDLAVVVEAERCLEAVLAAADDVQSKRKLLRMQTLPSN